MVLLCAWGIAPPAAAQAIDEAEAKASFLVNFARFVQWPAEPRPAIVLCVAGDDPLASVLQTSVAGRSIDGRRPAVRRLRRVDDPAGCHVLFVSASLQRQEADMLQRIKGAVLTIGETPQFLRDGGMVRFYLEDARVRFQVNTRAAEAAGLRIHSQVLSLAAALP